MKTRHLFLQILVVLLAFLLTGTPARAATIEILETFDDGKELVETVREWTGTNISQTLATRVERAMPPLTIQESVRLRALRAH